MTYDLVVRNGTVVDGSGWPRYRADVGIVDGRIARIGLLEDRGAQEIDADGLFVTPGFVDNHTHLDVQVCWDPFGPAAVHGVTSSVIGNCGIAAAPCHDAREREIFVIPAFAVAEDIHRATLDAAVDWEWETFADYLAYLDRIPKGMNFGANAGHGTLRTYVLGDRAYDKAAATDDEIAAMCAELESSLRAGALGFTSTLPGAMLFNIYADDVDVRDMDPRVVSGLATPAEVAALADVLARFGRGSIQLGGAYWDDAVALSARTRLPVQYVYGSSPVRDDWGLASFDEAAAVGANMIAAIPCRPQTSVIGFRARLPFDPLPGWRELRARPLAEQRAALTDPVRREELIDIARNGPYPQWHGLSARPPDWEKMSILDRNLPPFPTVAQRAAELGEDPFDVFLDLSLESDFHRLFSQPATFDHPRDTWLRMLRHPRSVVSVADTGAHVAQAMDWVSPTYFLGYWVRQEQEFTWEEGVRMFTFDPASVWGGLGGRGLLREGFVADLNVFDPDTIAPDMPDADEGLPAGGKRLTCAALGIAATIVNGEVVFRDGEHTGALPGRLLTGTARRGTGDTTSNT